MKILIILSLAATCLAGRAKPGNAQNVFQHASKPKLDKSSYVVSWAQLDNFASLNPKKNGNTEKRSEDFPLSHGFQGHKIVGPTGIVVQQKDSVIPENPSFIENHKEVLEIKKASSEESQDSDDDKKKISSSETSSQSFSAEILTGNGKKESSSSESSSQSSTEETNSNVTVAEVSSSKESNETSVNQKEENTNSPVVAENIHEDIAAPANNKKESPKPTKVNAEPKGAKNGNSPFENAFQPFVRSIGLLHKNRIRDVDTKRPKSVKAQKPRRRLLRSSDFDIVMRNDGQAANVREPQGRIQSRNKYVRRPSK